MRLMVPSQSMTLSCASALPSSRVEMEPVPLLRLVAMPSG